jgi:hypothetical protein
VLGHFCLQSIDRADVLSPDYSPSELEFRQFADLTQIAEMMMQQLTSAKNPLWMESAGAHILLYAGFFQNQRTSEAACGYEAGQKYYQLTHDYLVHSLRDWLTRKQRETQRGRAELRLAERAAAWNSKPENRHLPAWWEWLNIRLFTRKKDWTPPQRRMMRKAGFDHIVRGCAVAIFLTLLMIGGWWSYGTMRARHLVDTLLSAKTADVPKIIQGLEPYRRWAEPLLVQKTSGEATEKEQAGPHPSGA